MKDHRSLIAEVLRAIDIASPTSYRWFGVLTSVVPAGTESRLAASDARQFLRYALKNRLYADFYCPGRARAIADTPYVRRPSAVSPFLRTVSEANFGAGSRDAGWQVVRIDGECAVIERHGLRVWAQTTEILGPTPLEEGARVAVIMPNELFRLSPGFYMALSDCEMPDDGRDRQVRYYWNLSPPVAAPLMAMLTQSLNRQRIPFRFKVVDDEAGYVRADAGVLYVPLSHVAVVSTVVEDTYRELGAGLKARTPAFVQELAPGLGYAESPSDPMESFGTARCELLAEGILCAHEASADGPDETLAYVEGHFRASGIKLDAPYLSPASASDLGVASL